MRSQKHTLAIALLIPVLLSFTSLIGCGGRYTAGNAVNDGNEVVVEADLFRELIISIHEQHPNALTIAEDLEWQLHENPRTGNAEWAMLLYLQARYFWFDGNTSSAVDAISKAYGYMQEADATFVKLHANSRGRGLVNTFQPEGQQSIPATDVLRNDAELIAEAFSWARSGFAEVPLVLIDKLQQRGNIPVMENSPFQKCEMGPFYAIISQDTGLPVYSWREIDTSIGSYFLTEETVLLNYALTAIADFESAYLPPWENQHLAPLAGHLSECRGLSEEGKILIATVGILVGRKKQVGDFVRHTLVGVSSTTSTLFKTIKENHLRH